MSDNDGDRGEANAGNIVIGQSLPRVRLAELFLGKSPEDWRAAYAGAYDWGSNVGREIIED